MRTVLSHVCVGVFAYGSACGAAEAPPENADKKLPSIVRQEIANDSQDCEKVEREKGFITQKDVNGDGVDDYVLDYRRFKCDGAYIFCGSGGCILQIFASVSKGSFEKVYDELGFSSLEFTKLKGRYAVVVTSAIKSCDQDKNVCVEVGIWNGKTFKFTMRKEPTCCL